MGVPGWVLGVVMRAVSQAPIPVLGVSVKSCPGFRELFRMGRKIISYPKNLSQELLLTVL
jgi:hypothetical protein